MNGWVGDFLSDRRKPPVSAKNETIRKIRVTNIMEKTKGVCSEKRPHGMDITFFLIGASIFAERKISYISDNRLIFSSIFLVLLLIITGVTVVPMFRNMRKIGLICPYCGQLLDRYHFESTLKNSNCRKCGQIIIK
jgi:hypothetical protein